MKRLATVLMTLGCALLLAGMASLGASIYGYAAEVGRARQAVLEEDRRAIKGAIVAYTQDEGHSPATLDDLVTAGYLKCLPGRQFLPQPGDARPACERDLQQVS